MQLTSGQAAQDSADRTGATVTVSLWRLDEEMHGATTVLLGERAEAAAAIGGDEQPAECVAERTPAVQKERKSPIFYHDLADTVGGAA